MFLAYLSSCFSICVALGRFFVCCSYLWSFVALPPLCGGVPARTLCRLCLSCTCLAVRAGDLYFCLHGLFHTRKLSPGRHIGWLVLGAWRHKVTFLSIDFNIRMSVSLPPSLSLPVFGGVLATALCVLCTISFSLSPPVYSFFSRCRWYWHQSSVVHVWFLRIIVFFLSAGGSSVHAFLCRLSWTRAEQSASSPVQVQDLDFVSSGFCSGHTRTFSK